MTPEVAEWFGVWWPIWSPIVLLILGAITTGIITAWNRRGGEKVARRSPLPPTWPEMWARIDDLEKRLEAVEAERDEIIAHVKTLEAGYPNPPGPPPRPWVIPTPHPS